jgi:hypothetical protein
MARKLLIAFLLVFVLLTKPGCTGSDYVPVKIAIASSSPVVSGQQASELSISFTNTSSAQILPSSFMIGHERILHVVAMGEDLDTFAHVHPEDFGLNTTATGVRILDDDAP